MQKWDFINGHSNRYAVVNRTGATAHKVRVQVSGGFMVGMVGQSNWSTTVDQVPDGNGIEFSGQKAWGGDDARVQVTWCSDPEREAETTQMTTFRP